MVRSASKENVVNKVRSDASHSKYWVPILGSAIRILEAFYDAESDLTLQQICAKAKVGKTSAFRILFTLDQLGYVDKDPVSGKYNLGQRILAAARKAITSGGLVKIASPHLKRLRDEFDETTNLAVLRKDEIVYLEIFESPHSFRMADTVGARIPWHSTALGKAIAAYLSEDRLKRVLRQSSMKRFTPRTITTLSKYYRVLEDVKKQGYSLDIEESELGATCIASPIFSEDNTVVGALSVSGPTPRMQDKQSRIANSLKEASETIGRSLASATVSHPRPEVSI
jgi:DNA-binding IclR family transcriptional regulator